LLLFLINKKKKKKKEFNKINFFLGHYRRSLSAIHSAI
jgi:hypothetical protein